LLVLEPGRGDQQSGDEAGRGTSYGEAEGVAFGRVFEPSDLSAGGVFLVVVSSTSGWYVGLVPECVGFVTDAGMGFF